MIRRLIARFSRMPSRLPNRPRRGIGLYWHRFFSRPFNVAGFVFLTVVVAAGVFADFLASDKPIAYSLDGKVHLLPDLFGTADSAEMDNWTVLDAVAKRGGWAILPLIPIGPNQTKLGGNINWLQAPNRSNLLGTDDAGRNVLARIIHSARSALVVGLGSAGLSALIGLLLGALAGYFGGLLDRICLRSIETLSSFPSLFLILAIQGLIGATSVFELVLIIGLTRWTDVARLTRAEVLRIVNEDYITAARALGLDNLKILWRHVLPGAMEPVAVAATFGVASAILIESTLSFLGFGVPPTTPSWGQLLTDGFRNEGCYWLSIFPGIALSLTVLSINLVGEGMREALDRSSV